MLKELQILSIFDVIEGNYTEKFKEYDIISIRDTGTNNLYKLLDSQLKRNICKSYKVWQFDDIISREPLKKLVEYNDIVDILNFAKDKEKLIVHCNMGVSRSSACAFLIKYAECLNSKEALDILNRYIHNPNHLIIELGSKILNAPQLSSDILEFKRGILQLPWDKY